jgi:CheY-like chemotaxis protein
MANILVVDPNEASLDMLQEFCTEEMHIDCRTTHNGQEALQILSEDPPDLVLSEIEMSDLDGFELVRRIREATPSVPVVLMADDTADYKWLDALERGAKDFFTKPLSLMMLKVELLRLLQ